MVSASQPGQRTRRARVAIEIAVLLLMLIGAGVAGAYFWWHSADPAKHPLGKDWAARVITLAGTGALGERDGDIDHARLSDPFGIAAAGDGSVVVSDAGVSQRVRRIGSDGSVVTIAGGSRGFADGASA